MFKIFNSLRNNNAQYHNNGVQAYNSNKIDYISAIANMGDMDFITCHYDILSNLEIVNPVVKRYINQPVDDAFKDGFKIRTPSLSEDQISTLYSEMQKRGIIEQIKEACKLSRLYGGSILVFGSHDRKNNEINKRPVSLKGVDLIKAISRWEFSSVHDHGKFAELATITMKINNASNLSYNGVSFHPSRLVPFASNLPKSRKGYSITQGWGFSSLEHIREGLVLYKKQEEAFLDFITKAKIDKIKIADLAKIRKQPNADQLIGEMLNRIATQRNASSVMLLDSNDEFGTDTLDFAGISQAQADMRKMLYMTTGIPAEKLAGNQEGGSGLGGTQDQLEVYNALVNGEVREPAKPSMIQCTNIVAKFLFDIDYLDDLQIEFPSMRESTDAEMETMKTAQLNRLTQTLNDGIIDEEEYKEAVNNHDLLGITL